DDRIRVAAIGPGGENLVRFACIMNDLKDAAGRGGMGAVMGSKNLKAVAVRGHEKGKVADAEKLKEMVRWLLQNPKAWSWAHDLGTGGAMEAFVELGNFPIRNFRDGDFSNAKALDARTIKDTISIGMESCYACPVRCKKVVKIEEPWRVDPVYGGPEYEALAALGSNCGVDDLKAVCKANEICNRYSLDVISTGDTIAFAMECYERGKLTKVDMDGFDLRFGNDEALIEMIRKIAYREGFGNLLAEGVKALASKLDAEDYAIQIKGLELSGFDVRGLKGAALAYAVSNRGGCHLRGRVEFIELLGLVDRFKIEGKARRVKEREDLFTLLDSLIVCKFTEPVFDLSHLAKAYSLVTGENLTEKELLQAGERTVNLERLFISREGLSRKD
ncbi:aldehyde ferredoxin oxidoreductase, partial [Candidatus Bathyarchaeota archaeon]|nr:aldehyde ferredoxin oxidoreductase [Candidatus Bathyarchaeota archaeon]